MCVMVMMMMSGSADALSKKVRVGDRSLSASTSATFPSSYYHAGLYEVSITPLSSTVAPGSPGGSLMIYNTGLRGNYADCSEAYYFASFSPPMGMGFPEQNLGAFSLQQYNSTTCLFVFPYIGNNAGTFAIGGTLTFYINTGAANGVEYSNELGLQTNVTIS